LEYIDWWIHHRLLGEIGMTPPAEAEAVYYRQLQRAETAFPNEARLYRTDGGSDRALAKMHPAYGLLHTPAVMRLAARDPDHSACSGPAAWAVLVWWAF
jgi:hypothetical protein